MGLLRCCFARTQTWLQAGRYLNALVSDLPSRNGWSVAEHAGDRSPARAQRLLSRASWDERAAMSQVRKYYTAIARHAVLVMAALAICAVTAAQLRDRTGTEAPPPAGPDAPPPADPGLIPLTVREVRRLLAAALDRPRPSGHAARWVKWRRRHQARSRWFHKRARLARNYALVR